MEARLFEGYSLKERQEMLNANASAIEKKTYSRPLDQAEIAKLQTEFAQKAIDLDIAENIANQVCIEFAFAMNEISAFKDTFAKKVVVFILVKHFGYDKRNVGNAFKMTYLYVPTVVAEMDLMLTAVPSLVDRISHVLKNLNYG